jgi:hypothetical protein
MASSETHSLQILTHVLQCKLRHVTLLTASTAGGGIWELKLFRVEEVRKYFEELLNMNI